MLYISYSLLLPYLFLFTLSLMIPYIKSQFPAVTKERWLVNLLFL